MTAFTIRNLLAAGMAVGCLTAAGAATAQADNSNSAIAPAPSGGATMYYGPGTIYHGPGTVYSDPGLYYDKGYARQAEADARARRRAQEADILDRQSVDAYRRQGVTHVDPVTGVVTAPGYMGPRVVTK